MGRYSAGLAPVFADAAGVFAGSDVAVLDVGCGPGALTGVLVDRLGSAAVSSCDPSPPFVTACSARFPQVTVRLGRAEELPFQVATFDVVLAQLVMHFVSDPATAANEMRRVVKPGGLIGACVWDFADEMEMLRHFWDAALVIDPTAPDEARTLRFGQSGEIAELFADAGYRDIVESTLTATTTYADFDELWTGFLGGVGRAGSYCVALDEHRRGLLRNEMFRSLGSPSGTFTLSGTARCATSHTPG